MNTENDRHAGFAFVMDFNGKVIEILWDDLGFEKIQSEHFLCLVDPEFIREGLNFFSTVTERSTTFNWPLRLNHREISENFLFSATTLIDQIICMVTPNISTKHHAFPDEDDTSSNLESDHLNVSYFSPQQGRYDSILKIEDSASGEKMIADMMRMNNMLINTERQLARKTAELARLGNQMSRDLHLAEKVLEFTGEALLVLDKNSTVIYANSAFIEITGYSRSDVINQVMDLVDESDTPHFSTQDIMKVVREKKIWRGEYICRKKDGSKFTKLLSVSMIPDDSGLIDYYIACFTDISRLKNAEAQWQFLAYYDNLTKLPNRTLCKDRLHQAIAKSHRSRDSLALLFLDLDDFKIINDSLGHDAGDTLLCEFAHIIQNSIRKTDTVYRLGGDEFTIILQDCENNLDIVMLCDKLIRSMKDPIYISGQKIHIGVSIGIARYPEDGHTVDELTKHADIAMYAAKNNGKNRSRFFSSSLGEKVSSQLNLRSEISQGLENAEFFVCLQPEIDLKSGKIIAGEALVRWRHPSRGLVSPDEFISAAEESGLIVRLGEFVMRESLCIASNLRRSGHPLFRVAVNVSSRQLASSDFVGMVTGILREMGLPGTALIIEITETMVLEDVEHVIEVLKELREQGVEAAMDDFGTGYSSLRYLHLLPISYLKIDKSFIKEIDIDEDKKTIVRTILAMAHTLGIKSVAEGIEQLAHQEILSGLSCDVGQGYYFSKPLPPKEFGHFLMSNGLQPEVHSREIP